MHAGQMRDWVEILTPSVIDDGRGGQTVVYPTSGPAIAAYIRAASNREQAEAGALQTVATHILEVYPDPRITADKRLKPVGRTLAGGVRPTLEIVGIREENTRSVLTLDCAEVI